MGYDGRRSDDRMTSPDFFFRVAVLPANLFERDGKLIDSRLEVLQGKTPLPGPIETVRSSGVRRPAALIPSFGVAV
jgi:hypothetical protein